MALYRSNAVVLRNRNIGEADRILLLLSEDHGKFEAVVKGARRGRSRFVGNTLPFNYLKAMFCTGKSLDILSQAELLHSFASLREDLDKMAYASFWAELIDGFVPERQESREIFRFVLAAFLVLEQSESPELLNLAFQARLLNYLGYCPVAATCAGCGQAIPAEIEGECYFSAAAGGALCPTCRLRERDFLAVTITALKTMTQLVNADIRQLHTLAINPTDFQILRRILRVFIEYRLEKPLKSLVFLDSILAPG
ncbi:MAG: DNA repair protein RecO [Firmicutes bacterium]|nr:DNA repair protein RecO [Bacillota bacterium]